MVIKLDYTTKFCEKFDKGKISMHLAFIDHPEDFHVTVDVGIRFDELENMKNQWDEGLTIKEKKETYTIGVELGNLVHREQKDGVLKRKPIFCLLP